MKYRLYLPFILMFGVAAVQAQDNKLCYQNNGKTQCKVIDATTDASNIPSNIQSNNMPMPFTATPVPPSSGNLPVLPAMPSALPNTTSIGNTGNALPLEINPAPPKIVYKYLENGQWIYTDNPPKGKRGIQKVDF